METGTFLSLPVSEKSPSRSKRDTRSASLIGCPRQARQTVYDRGVELPVTESKCVPARLRSHGPTKKSPSSRAPRDEWVACHPLPQSGRGTPGRALGISHQAAYRRALGVPSIPPRCGLASIVLYHDAHTSFPFITIGVNWNHLDLVVSHFGKNGSHKARSLTRHGVRCENIRDSIETKACLSVMF